MNKCIFLLGIIIFSLNGFGQKKIVVKFEQIANGKKIVLNDSLYKNDFGEKYTVSKLKYYVSNISFMMNKTDDNHKKVFLIDQTKLNSLKFDVKGTGEILGISFLVSGAQKGALDPLNDMFWTWNNGYVMFKLEGTSLSSTADKNRIEQHIGGYKGEYKTMRKIFLSIDEKYFLKNNTITIQMNLDKYWNGIKIAETPVISTSGVLAKKAADNFTKLFSIKN
jgi:hypothetical protein